MIPTHGDCICKICDCGRHRCPHKSHPVEGWGTDVCSEYGHQYQARDACRPASCKPPHNPITSECPLATLTTNRADYVAHDVQPVKRMDAQPYEPDTTPMADQSVYRHEFTEKPQCASKMIRPVSEVKDNGKFDSQTTNRSHYVPWDVCPPEIKGPEKYVPPKEPFEAMNTYRSDFIGHNQAKVSSCKPPITSLQSDAPFDGISEQHHSYVCHNIEPRHEIAKTSYIKTEAPFEGMTTNRQDYVPLDVCKPHSLKPPATRINTDQPFSSDTTNRSDYVAHPSQVPAKHDHESYVKPEGDMDLKTTYNEHYVTQPNCKLMPIKPPLIRFGNEPFDGETVYRQNYKKWDQPANIIQHKENYVPLNAPFDSSTTTGTAYIHHNIERQHSCKPPTISTEKLPFDGQTLYRTEFVNKNLHVCPAASLSQNPRSISPDGYRFTGEDEEGHMHFTRSTIHPNIPMVA